MRFKTNEEKIRPSVRESAMEHGLSYLFDEELVMLILGTGNNQMPVEIMADRMMSVLDDSDQADVVKNLLKLKGVGQGKALAVAAALELGRRRNAHLCAPVKSSSDVVPFVQNYAVCTKEHFLLVTLSGSHEIIQIHVVTVGTLTRGLIHPREIYGTAMRENAAAVIVCHNHPSGNCEPSEEDILVTHNLERAGEIMGIQLLDHIIICRDSYFSFMDSKMLLRSSGKAGLVADNLSSYFSVV